MDLDDIYAIENADTLGRHQEINKILSDQLIELAVEINDSSICSEMNLLNSKIVKRYKGVNESLFSSILVEENNSINEDNNSDISRLTLSWIALGSALESSIQLFLISYKSDYENNPFSKWDDFNDEYVSEKIDDTLTDLRDEEIISGKQRRSLKKRFDNIISLKKTGFEIERIGLSDLINYFIKEIADGDELTDIPGYQGEFLNEINLKKDLHNIRRNRNIVHVFTDDDLDNWNSFKKHLKIYYIVLLFLIERMRFLQGAIEDMKINSGYR